MPRTEAMSRLWRYIKPEKGRSLMVNRYVVPDDALAEVFGSYDRIHMLDLTVALRPHLTRVERPPAAARVWGPSES